jgi:hypothetical protein
MTIVAVTLTTTNVALASAGIAVLVAYVFFILVPACGCYSRVWEKAAAAFLTTFILAGLIATGAAIGAALVWSYDRWA